MTSQYSHGFLLIFFGGKYDLIQLHRQIIHQNAWNFFVTTKITSPLALLVKNLKKTMKMTLLQLFGLVLFSAHVYGRPQLVATCSLQVTK